MKNFGLKKTLHDPRDYSLKKTFGNVVVDIPDEFMVGDVTILNQQLSNFCTAFASCLLASLEDNQQFSPEWFFAKEAQISGQIDGQDLRTACKAAVKYGFLPQIMAQHSLSDETPDYLADPQNWLSSDDLAAEIYKKKSYFRVDGNFQEVKQTLWQNKDEHRAILTGVDWGQDWETIPSGIITDYQPSGSLHCIPIVGVKKINGIDYRVIANSYGTAVGDNGLFYIPEDIFNQVFTEPMYMFVDLNDQTIPQPIGSFWEILIFMIRNLFN